MVRHQHHWKLRLSGEVVQRADQSLPCSQIKAGVRLIEQQQFRVGHQRPSDQHAFLLALGHRVESPISEFTSTERVEEILGTGEICILVVVPPGIEERGVLAGDDNFQAVVALSHQVLGCGPHIADAFAKITHVRFSERDAEHGHPAAGRKQIGRDHVEQGGFSATVWAEKNPSLVGFDSP